MKRLPIFICIFFGLTNGFLYQPGETVMPVLKLPVSARVQSQGGAGVASPVDGGYATLNPAGIQGFDRFAAYFEHLNFLQGMRMEFLHSTLVYRSFKLGLSVQYFDLGEAPITVDGSRYDEGNVFHSYDVSAAVTSGFSLGAWDVGLSLKYLREAIWYDGIHGAALDAGAVYRTPIKNLTAGASLLNMGYVTAFVKETFPVTPVVRAGLCYRIDRLFDRLSIEMLADIEYGLDNTLALPVGLSADWEYFSLRTGYALLHDTRTYSLGAGVTFGDFILDYCFAQYADDLSVNGKPHFFSLTAFF